MIARNHTQVIKTAEKVAQVLDMKEGDRVALAAPTGELAGLPYLTGMLLINSINFK